MTEQTEEEILAWYRWLNVPTVIEYRIKVKRFFFFSTERVVRIEYNKTPDEIARGQELVGSVGLSHQIGRARIIGKVVYLDDHDQ